MKRREFIMLISGAATCPLVARAQQSTPVVSFFKQQIARRIRRVGWGVSPRAPTIEFVEGQNVIITLAAY